MAHIAKLRKPSNEQAHATPKRWYLPNKATEVSDLIMIGHDSLSSCMSLAILLYCITPQRLCGADQHSARRLRGGHPFSNHMYLHRSCRERQDCTEQAP